MIFYLSYGRLSFKIKTVALKTYQMSSSHCILWPISSKSSWSFAIICFGNNIAFQLYDLRPRLRSLGLVQSVTGQVIKCCVNQLYTKKQVKLFKKRLPKGKKA